jgi:hypothetical protein
MGLLKVGKDIPELTPVEIDTSVTDLPIVMGQLMGWNRDRVWSVKREPPVACDGEDVSKLPAKLRKHPVPLPKS